jgi:hypothetical protein
MQQSKRLLVQTAEIPYSILHKWMMCDHFLHILRHLQFENKGDPPNRNDSNYERLWKIRKTSDILNNKFCKLYNQSAEILVWFTWKIGRIFMS